jgi:hypothetical protein
VNDLIEAPTPTLQERAILVAAALAARTGQPWRPSEGDDYGRHFAAVELATDPECRITFNDTWSKGKLAVRGRYPRHAGTHYPDQREQAPTINIGAGKSPEQVAADVARRLLPAYLKSYAAGRQRLQESKDYDARRAALAADLAARCGEQAPSHTPHRFSTYRGEGAYVRSCEAWADDTCTIELNHVAADLARRIIALVYSTP